MSLSIYICRLSAHARSGCDAVCERFEGRTWSSSVINVVKCQAVSVKTVRVAATLTRGSRRSRAVASCLSTVFLACSSVGSTETLENPARSPLRTLRTASLLPVSTSTARRSRLDWPGRCSGRMLSRSHRLAWHFLTRLRAMPTSSNSPHDLPDAGRSLRKQLQLRVPCLKRPIQANPRPPGMLLKPQV